MQLETYIQYHETKLHEQPGFSYNTYLCTIPQDFLRVDLHWHEQMELIYVKKGSGTVMVNTNSLPVEAGSIIPILPGELHAIEGTKGVRMEYENIIFSLSILDSADEHDWCRSHIIQALQNGNLYFERPIRPGSEFHKAVSSALDGADHACEHRVPGYSLLVKSYLFLFLHALYTHQTKGNPVTPSLHEETIKQVISYVREHFSEPITITEAAALTRYSEAHFMRIFRQETGQTFVNYLTDYRLGYASYLLKESMESVSLIAEKCGFDNFSYFSRIFKKRYKLSPREYRKSLFKQ